MDHLTAHDHDYDSDSSHESTGSSYSSPTDPDNWIRSGRIWPLYAESLPPLEQQYYSDRGRPPGILQPLPNIAVLKKYNDSCQDNLSLSSRLRHWRSSGSSWTLYISSLSCTLHHRYLTIPPSIDHNYFNTRPVPTTNIDHPTPSPPTQTNHNSPALEGYLATAPSSKQSNTKSTPPTLLHSYDSGSDPMPPLKSDSPDSEDESDDDNDEPPPLFSDDDSDSAPTTTIHPFDHNSHSSTMVGRLQFPVFRRRY